MAADYNKPVLGDTYSNVLSEIRDNFADLVKMAAAGSNVPTDAIRFNATTKRWEKYNGSTWVELIVKASDKYDINVDRVDGYDAGNSSGNIPVSNGTLNTDLNADKVDGANASAAAGAGQIPILDGGGKILSTWIPNTAITPGTYKSATFGADGRATGGTNPTTLAGYGITDAAALVGSASQTFSVATATLFHHAARIEQMQKAAAITATCTGTDTYTASLSPALSVYQTGILCLIGNGGGANTSTTPTMNFDGLGALTMKHQNGNALRAGDFSAGGWYVCSVFWSGVLATSSLLLHTRLHRPAYGKQAIWIPASAMTPSTSGGCAALATIASGASQPDIQTLDFDASSQEFAQFSWRMPKSWNEGTVTFEPVWSHAATATNFGVVWQLQGLAVSNDDAIGAAYGTAQTSTDTGGTTNDVYVGPESSAITIGGSPAVNDAVFFRIARNPTDGNDTLAIDARLHGVTLYITTDTENDA